MLYISTSKSVIISRTQVAAMVIEIHLYGVRIYEYIEQKDGLNSIGFLVAEYDKMR